MKLVEILARTWSKWQVGRNYKVSQSEFGVLYVSFENSPNGTTINLGWQCDIATDWKSAVVTRAQWEEERARIAAEEGHKALVDYGIESLLERESGNSEKKQANTEPESGQRTQYEQELWDKVASDICKSMISAYPCQAIDEEDGGIQINAEHVVADAFDFADAFMAERANRLNK